MTKPVTKMMLGVLVGCLCLNSWALAEESPGGDAKMSAMPASLVSGDIAYKKDGAEAFLDALLKGSYPNDSTSKMPMLEQAHAVGQLLQQVEALYGRYKGLELIGTLMVAKSTRVVYYVLNYERGPVYGVLSVYRADEGEIVTGYAVNTELHKVLPPILLIDRMKITDDEQ